MRFRRVLAAAATTVLVAGMGIAGATSAAAASADPADMTVDCYSLNTNGGADQAFAGAVGDTFTVTSSDGYCWIASTSGDYAGQSFDGYSGIVTVTGTDPNSGADLIAPGGTATFTIVANGSFTMRHGSGIAYASTITVDATASTADAPPIPRLGPGLRSRQRRRHLPRGLVPVVGSVAEQGPGRLRLPAQHPVTRLANSLATKRRQQPSRLLPPLSCVCACPVCAPVLPVRPPPF